MRNAREHSQNLAVFRLTLEMWKRNVCHMIEERLPYDTSCIKPAVDVILNTKKENSVAPRLKHIAKV